MSFLKTKHKGQGMKHEWRKHEKGIYLPKTKPELIDVPNLTFLTIEGEGNPNSDHFAEHIAVLYALSYGVKMTLKKDTQATGYFDYTVYPLEGIWDINEKAKASFDGSINKDDLVFQLMIRQPAFITIDFFQKILAATKLKKPKDLLDKVVFEELEEGRCIQMLHLGSYDNEASTFQIMEDFAQESGLKRRSKIHREIYLSDARKVAPEKLKTVLRFQVD